MMELRRKCAEKIKKWYFNSRKALLVKGARQVGKTHLIRSVLSEIGCDYLEINLIEKPEAISVLNQATSVDELIIGLSTVSEKRLEKGRTVIFIDEVQKCKEMVTRIKFLVDEGSFRYVLSGSLLGVELTGLNSAPVGYLSILDMYPLDFEEFLQITNVGAEILSSLKDSFDKRTPVMDAVNSKMLDLFTRYLAVGGMPEAVARFAETSSINDVISIHKDISALYHLDFTQYEVEDRKLLITRAYDLIPSELLKQNRRFVVTDISKGLRFERMENTFLWLENSGVAITSYNATEPRIPLRLNEKHSLFKMYLADVGMLTSSYGMPTKRMLIGRDSNLNAGGIYENVMAQELCSKGYSLYYYNSNRLGELDFVIEYEGKALPIEIKSGKDYRYHSAISNCLNNSEYEMDQAFVFANCNVFREGKIVYLPAYMIMFMDKRDEEDLVLDRISF